MPTIKTREIQYSAQDGTTLIGYFAAPESSLPLAAVIVAPEWWGRNDYTEQRARELAEHGYAAFAIDMYGNKNVTLTSDQAYQWMMQTFEDPNTIVDRATAALNTLAEQPEVDAQRLAAIGFCYGGKVVLDLARSNAPVKAVATFHGNLSAKAPAQAGQVQAELLVMHGELDSMVSLDDVQGFRDEMDAAQVAYDVMVFKNAKHGFTNPQADDRAQANNVDLAYNATAEQQSLAAMYQLLARRLN